MVFAAPKLRLHPKLGRPTVIIVADYIDLDTQIPGDITADLSEQDHDDLATSCAKMAVLGKKPGVRSRRGATQGHAFSDEG